MVENAERIMLDACAHIQDEAVADIMSAIRIPGVSKTASGLDRMAAMVAERLTELSVDVRRHEGLIAPILEGVARSPGTAGKLLFYTLYDVQPADNANWTSPPFEGAIESDSDGRKRLVGRGAFNSKGPLFAFLAVMREFRRRNIPLPVDIHFVIEGEEEIGSPSLEPFVKRERAQLGECDGVLIPYFGSDSSGLNIIRLGFNGLGFIEVSVEGGNWGGPARQPIHSLHNGWIASPAWELVRALATLRNAEGDLACEGLRSQWWGAEQEAMALEAETLLDGGSILAGLGASRFSSTGSLGHQLYRLLGQPTINIDALASGQVPGDGQPATLIPNGASAWLDMRFTPGMDPAGAIALLRNHFDKHGFDHVEMKIGHCYPASLSDRGHPIVAAMEAACNQHCDRVAVLPLHAGAAPLYVFSEIAGIPYAFGGLGYGGKSHAPNEFIDVNSVGDFMRSMVSFLYRFAERLPC